jgi:RNA polymerase sigma-32 factor
MSEAHGADSDGEDSIKIAAKLRVKPAEVEEMSQRMLGRDFSLDAPIGDGGTASHMDSLAGDRPAPDVEVSTAQQERLKHDRVGEALARLDPRERYIIEQRVMRDEPVTLRDLGEHFGVSRERARQLELRAKEKLKHELHGLAVDIEWPTIAA